MVASTQTQMPPDNQLQSFTINPGKGLGFILLGGSIRDILTRIRSQPDVFPKLKIQFSAVAPLSGPVNVILPSNGLRLRFDGTDQRLRLIEILDFTKILLTYKGQDLIKSQELGSSTGPSFRHIYSKLLGPTFEGEHFQPSTRNSTSLYVLSYPGVAFSFNVIDWPGNSDFVSVLSSPATSPAVALSIFNGSSWKDARKDLYLRTCPHPRSLSLSGKPKDSMPDEIELAIIKGRGKIEFKRRYLPSFDLVLGETTSQDLNLTIGPPDAIYRKNDRRLSIHKEKTANRRHQDLGSSPIDKHIDTDISSISTTTDYSGEEDEVGDVQPSSSNANDPLSQECFYNYFSHGFDILMSHQINPSPDLLPTPPPSPSPHADFDQPQDLNGNNLQYPFVSTNLVATKLILHGNIPGSHSFNRHRRIRWLLDSATLRERRSRTSFGSTDPLTSETPFHTIRSVMNDIWTSPDYTALGQTIGPISGLGSTSRLTSTTTLPTQHHAQRFMVLNRNWGSSPGSSISLLGGWEDDDIDEEDIDPDNSTKMNTDEATARTQAESKKNMKKKSAMGNTELHGWPGLLFEVLKNDVVDCLTVY